MPPLVAAVSAYFAVSSAMAVFIVATAVVTLASVAYSAYMMATMDTGGTKPDASTRLQTVRSSVQPHRVIYGECMTGGVLVYAQSHGDNNKYISLVVAFTGHEVEEIKEVWLNDKISNDNTFVVHHPAQPEQGYWTDDIVRDAYGSPIRDKYNALVYSRTYHKMRDAVAAYDTTFATIRKYRGTPDQLADPDLVALPPKPTTVISQNPSSGLNDLSIINDGNGEGTYSAAGMAVFHLRMATAGVTDTFTWTKTTYAGDGETAVTTAPVTAVVTGAGQTLSDGINIQFGAATGHSVGQEWEIRAFDGAPWTADCRLQGRSYVVVTLENNDTAFPNGLPNIKALIRGNNQIYDPRTGTIGYTDNWALCVRDYLTKPYGLNTPDSGINSTSAIAAANISDENITLANGSTQARYTLNGSFTVDKTPTAIMNEMLAAAYGAITWTQGQYRILPAAYYAPDLTFHGLNAGVPGLTESDLRGPIKVRPSPSMKDKFNAVVGTYISPETWQPVDFPKVKNSLYLSQDDDNEVTRDIQLNYVTDPARAQRIAKIVLEKARQGITVDFPAKWSAFPLAVGDTVPISVAHLGWVQKIFTVRDWKMNPEGGVDLSLQEEAAGCYSWDNGEETTVDLAPNTILPDPLKVSIPTGLTVAEELYTTNTESAVKSRAILTWDDMGARQYEVNYLPSNNSIWAPLPLTTDTVCMVDDTMPGNYSFRVRAMNAFGVWGAWSTITAALLGKMAPPPPVSTFLVFRQPDGTRQFTWTCDAPLDLAGYRIRYISGTDGEWATMSPLHDGLLTSSPYETNQLPAGAYVFSIITEDTSGNTSPPIYIETTLEDPRLADVILDRYPEKLGWPGTFGNCYMDELGQLVAKDQKTWADFATDGVTWNGWTTWARNPFTSITYTDEVIDLGVAVPFTPSIAVQADGTVSLEMRTSDDGSTWSSYAATGFATKRYVQFRITVTNSTGLAILKAATIYLSGKPVLVELNDLVTSSLSGSYRIGTGDIRLPVAGRFSKVNTVFITLQNVGAGWSYELIDKTNTYGPRVKIYNASNALADATIDAYIKGV